MHDKTTREAEQYAAVDTPFGREHATEDKIARAQLQFVIGEQQVAWKRIVQLEQQVANQALAMRQTHTVHTPIGAVEVKSQAAAAQATEHLYAPLRSDTKPLLEMSAFVRKVAGIYSPEMNDKQCLRMFIDLTYEARDILKRST